MADPNPTSIKKLTIVVSFFLAAFFLYSQLSAINKEKTDYATKAHERHVFAITEKKAEEKPTAPVAESTVEKVWISKSDASLQCVPGSEHKLISDQKLLEQKGIKVFESKKGSDGKVRGQMCNSSTGRTNDYLIKKEDLEKASSLEFVQRPGPSSLKESN